MATFCIPKHIAEKLKESARQGEINIEKMYGMTSKERRDLFAKYTGDDMAKEINSGFEKAMNSETQTALKSWVQSTFSSEQKKNASYKDVLQKIDDLNNQGLLSPEGEKGFLQDLVAEKLGATVSEGEAKVISTLSTELQALSKDKSEFGTPTVEYFKKRKEMEDYINGLVPDSRLRILTSTIGRGNLLFRVPSMLLNIESNTLNGLLSAFERRITTRKVTGKNTGYAIKYAKFVNEVFNKTGYDVSRMQSIQSDRTIRGERGSNTQGPGFIRKVARGYEDVVFNKMQGSPDVVYSSLSFADRANIESTKLAKGDRAKALEIFKDATSIEPQTPEGVEVRNQSIADAMYSTYTNKSDFAEASLKIRDAINVISKDTRLGDNLIPFVKTTANAISAGVDYSGVTTPFKGIYKLANMAYQIKHGKHFNEARAIAFKGFGVDLTRAGLGLTAAFVLSNAINPDDFMGNYPLTAKEKELFKLKRAVTNSVRINGKWYSLDFFGPLAPAITGFLYAKKYGHDLPSQALAYSKGVIDQAIRVPGLETIYNTIDSIKNQSPDKVGVNVKDDMNAAATFLIDFAVSRSIPGQLSDIAKIKDTKERDTSFKSTGDLTAPVKNAIPGLRETLPGKINIFGEQIKTEDMASILTTGGRSKTASIDPIVQEFDRLAKTGNLPAIGDVIQPSGKLKELQAQIGKEKFREAMTTFGHMYKKDVKDFINSNDYKDLSDEDRKKEIDNIKDHARDYILEEYNYQKPEKS